MLETELARRGLRLRKSIGMLRILLKVNKKEII